MIKGESFILEVKVNLWLIRAGGLKVFLLVHHCALLGIELRDLQDSSKAYGREFMK